MSSLGRHAAASALLLATLAVYAPYVTTRLVSGNPDGDGATYLVVLADACAQARQGVFPVYVGQSELRFNGGLYPQAQAPLLTLLGPALDLLSARALEATVLLNAIVLLVALGGALSMWLVLRHLEPERPWTGAALAFAYVACPGVLGVLVRLDMLTTFLALPLLPWVWHALLQAWEGHETRAGVTLGLTLAWLWAAHPPVALWATACAVCVGLIGLGVMRRGLRAALVAAVVFAAAFAWPLVTVLELTGGRAANVGLGTTIGRLSPETVARTLASVRGDFPGALLPVGAVRGHAVSGWPMASAAATWVPPEWATGAVLPYLQLGWLSWAALALGLAVAWRRREPRLVVLLAGALGVAAFVLPLPLVTERLWALLPGVFDVTKWWPMQRLYIVLASLAAPIGLLAWRAWPSRRPRVRVWVAALLVAWSAHEAAQFTRLGFGQRARGPAATALENVRLHAKDLQSAAVHVLPEFTDPWLHARLVDATGRARLDNLDAVRAACAQARPLPLRPDDPTLARVTLEPGRRTLLCVRDAPLGLLEAYAPDYYRHARLDAAATAAAPALLPLFVTRAAARAVDVRLVDRAGRRARLDGGRVTLATYDTHALPVRIDSWIPLRATVTLDGDATGLRLETPRQFVPGYRARVDGHDVPVERSPRGLVAVPIGPGAHALELTYVGPSAARAAFPVSLVTWLLAAGWLAWPRGRVARIG